MYEVEFDSGETEAYTANIIAEAIYDAVDDEGYSHTSISEIVNHKCDASALKGDDAYVVRKGQRVPKRTTKGWKLCVQWSDGSTSWESLKTLKETDPIAVAEYAYRSKLLYEPAFAWWAPYTLKHRDRIIKAFRKRYFQKLQKYGIEMPKTMECALQIDDETGTTFWHDAICKEMKAVSKAFEFLDEGPPNPLGHTEILCHMVFDVKPDFTRKARFVAGGHMTDPPSSITYASVVSQERVQLAFLLTALNDIEVKAAAIGNAYLNAPCHEKIFIKCGLEFGPEMVG